MRSCGAGTSVGRRGGEAADDLRPGDDRRDQPGDLVGLRVAVELEQVRLQGVEGVDGHAAGEQRLAWKRTGGTRQPYSAEATAIDRICTRTPVRGSGVKPMSS